MNNNEQNTSGKRPLNRKRIKTIVICIFLCAASYLIGAMGVLTLPGYAVIHNNDSQFLSEMVKMNELEKEIQSQYLKDFDSKAMGESAIKAMFDSLGDKYSVYYNSDEYANVSNLISGTFNGIGIYLDMSDPNTALVTRLVDGGPAQSAGIEAGDVITAVDGENVVGKDYEYILSKITGEKGSNVKITVTRNEETKDFDVTRGEINAQTVYSIQYDDIGYIYLSEFGKGSLDEFKEEAQKLIDNGARGLVIDLRFNGGGMLDTASGLADYLLGEGTTGSVKDKNGTVDTFTSDASKISVPYVILVNGDSASASEFLSGAVQQNGGTVIGTTTYGKGVAQILSGLSDGSGYKLTVEEYFVGDGVPVNGTGVTPNIIVEGDKTIVDGTADSEDQDTQLQTAIQTVRDMLGQ
ncbi:MAG: S41 family peptidase [Eubacteriaceae bacterium]|jgi:carboxyl-terminal processing protease